MYTNGGESQHCAAKRLRITWNRQHGPPWRPGALTTNKIRGARRLKRQPEGGTPAIPNAHFTRHPGRQRCAECCAPARRHRRASPCGDKLALSHVSEPRLAQTPEAGGGQILRVATSASLAQQKHTHAPVERHCMNGRYFRGCAHARLHKRPAHQHPRSTRLPIAQTHQVMLWQRVTLHRLVGRCLARWVASWFCRRPRCKALNMFALHECTPR